MGEKEKGLTPGSVASESVAPSASERRIKPGATAYGTAREESSGVEPTPAEATTGAPLKGVDVKLGESD